jgi:hypothetical protein
MDALTCFDCLLVASCDPHFDTIIARWLLEGGYDVEPVQASTLLKSLRARSRPAVILTDENTAGGEWVHLRQATAAAPAIMQQHGYVLFTHPAQPQDALTACLPPDTTVAIVPLPASLSQLVPTVEQVGRQALRRWTGHRPD